MINNISVKNINYKINRSFFFYDLSVNFLPKGISIILGPNGAGKSLLTRVLKGIVVPDKGDLSIVLNKRKPNIGYLSQNLVFLRRDVYGNLEYPMKIKGYSKNEISNRLKYLLRAFEFEKSKYASARSLSKGNKQYLSFIRTLVNYPTMLILDEPTSNLDMNYTKKIESYLLKIKKKTKIIMVTHDVFQAKRLADEIVFMNNGKLIEISETKNFLKSSNKIVKKFLSGSLF
tara:strand:+ start:30 stop:722 length:693 start_codon:yes stop_codon:yes gene_type:complete